MYKNQVISINPKSDNVGGVWAAAQNLSLDEKAELVEKLLGIESGLIVISASSHLADYIIAQMQLLSWEGLSYVSQAIAAYMSGTFNGSQL